LPKYSIIIPTYNNLENLKPCLESVIETSIDPEIVVVDNGSFDGTSAYLEFMHKRYAHFLNIISLDSNKGYAGGVNKGIKEAKGIYLICLNDDCITTPKWNLYLSEAMEAGGDECARIGIISPRTNYAVDHCRISNEEANYLGDPWGLANKIHHQFNKTISIVPWVPGVAMMIRRELIEKIDGFDERYFPGGFEDNDFCARAWHAGYRTAVAEGVFIVHKGSVTFKRFYPEMNIGLKNLGIYLEKWRNLQAKEQKIVLGSYIKHPLPEAINKIQTLAQRLDIHPLLEIEETNTDVLTKDEGQMEREAINKLLDKAHQAGADWILFMDPDDNLDDWLTASKLKELTHPSDPLITIYAFPSFKVHDGFYNPQSCSFTTRLYKLLPHRRNLDALCKDAPLARQIPFRITNPLELNNLDTRTVLKPYFNDYQITACMIARDEIEHIDSFLFKHGSFFHDFIIMDTGSIDNTIERLSNWPIKIINDGAFPDFSSARNKVMKAANTPWIMHLDWDEELLVDPSFFFQVHNPAIQGYFIPILSLMPQSKPSQTENVRLFRNKPDIYYQGLVHESVLESIIDQGQSVQMAEGLKINHFGYLKSRDRIQDKLEQYEALLYQEIAQDPFRARPYYDLALHYINERNNVKGKEFFRRALVLKPDLLLPRKELAFEHVSAAYKEFSLIAQGSNPDAFLTNICKKAVSILQPLYEPRIQVGNPDA